MLLIAKEEDLIDIFRRNFFAHLLATHAADGEFFKKKLQGLFLSSSSMKADKHCRRAL